MLNYTVTTSHKMQKLLTTFIILFCLSKIAAAQNATLHVSLKNSSAASVHIWIPALSFGYDYLKKGSFDVPVSAGAATHQFKITKPVFAYLMYSSSDADTAKSF